MVWLQIICHELLIIINLHGLSINVLRCQVLGSAKYRKITSIWHFEQCNQQLSNPICQNCDGSIKILLDAGNQQHAV